MVIILSDHTYVYKQEVASTWGLVASPNQDLSLPEGVQGQANGVAQPLANGLALLLAWTPIKYPLPASACSWLWSETSSMSRTFMQAIWHTCCSYAHSTM